MTQLANFSFYDVEAVEVTRGPRGTEGGLAASSGKVNVTSKLPTFAPTAELSAAYGQRESLILQGALGGTVIDNFLAWPGVDHSSSIRRGVFMKTNTTETTHYITAIA
ncbi:hypothetical protein CWO84_07550 [Methylomonas sp. Kb3]|nr:hypothetical protein CWO84_07550 [Methylomonas sp. Kb3]